MTEPTCACGQPLHYEHASTKALMLKLCKAMGNMVRIVHDGRVYQVQRHYIALHGVAAVDLPALAEAGIVKCDHKGKDGEPQTCPDGTR